MDATTFILRPSADISVGHTLYPEGSTAGYLLINEEVSDDGSTYISVSSSDTETETTATSSFKLSGDIPSDDIVVTGVDVVYSSEYNIYAGNAGLVFTPSVNNVSLTALTASIPYSFDTKTLNIGEEDISVINEHIHTYGSFPEITMLVESSTMGKEDNKGTKTGYVYLSQLYLNVYYNTGVYRRVSETWKPAFQLYQMINGSWSQITSANAKSILQSNYVKSGHSQVAVAGTSPTCTTTGLTTGYTCSICGETIKEQEVIPATGHTSVTVAGYAATCATDGLTNGTKCSVCGVTLTAQEIIPATGNHTYVASNNVHNACAECGYIQDFGYANLVYQGTATALSNDKGGKAAATTVGDYALFGGGDASTNIVDVYNKSLTHSTTTSLTAEDNYNVYRRYALAATTVGNYALFGGGGSTNKVYSYVDTYDSSLTHMLAAALSASRNALAATTVGNYALFGGGATDGNEDYTNTVDAYDTSLTRSAPTALSASRNDLAATRIGNYALFGGGGSHILPETVVDAYNVSLTHSVATELHTGRSRGAAITVGNYAIFGGGCAKAYNEIDVYNSSLTRILGPEMSAAKYDFTATTLGNYAIFGVEEDTDTVDIYNQSLTHTTIGSSGAKNYLTAATTVGNYALFGGGEGSTTVDVYTLQAK